MKKVIYLLAALAVLAMTPQAFAATVTLSWDAYTDTSPLGTAAAYDATNYKIEAQCRINGGDYLVHSSAPASATTVNIDLAAFPGDTVGCQIHALRISDSQASPWTPEVVASLPLEVPTTPTGLVIHF